MSKAEQEKIFTEFTRLPGAQGQEGFGLGLSITHKLIELQNGEISVESSPGHGSRFNVIIPLPSYVNEKPSEENKYPEHSISGLHILIIDDDSIQLNLTRDMFLSITSVNKCVIETIVCCQHPEEIFTRIKEEMFDILFTDIQMPAMDGFHLLKMIRSIPCEQAKRIPVVAITARAIPNDEVFRERGFTAVLRKPFSRKDIIRVLDLVNGNQIDKKENDTCGMTDRNDTNVIWNEFNFSRLTEFSMDDDEAARRIFTTFADETQKNINKMKNAISKGDTKEICSIAHKMLPTFIMIEAREAIPSLQWLDEHKEQETDFITTKSHACKIIKTVITAIQAINQNIS